MKLRERLEQLYPAVETPGSPFKTTGERVALYVADAGFNCHHRILAQAYPEKTYTYQTAFWNGTHYMDQFPSFFDPSGTGINGILSQLSLDSSGDLKSAQAFQSYLVSEILSGNPNTYRDKMRTIEWPVTTGISEPALKGVLNFTNPVAPGAFSIITSRRLVKNRCDYWTDLWSELNES
jgi:hypothetical protein